MDCQICRYLEAHLEHTDAVHSKAMEALRAPGRAEDAVLRQAERITKLAPVRAEFA